MVNLSNMKRTSATDSGVASFDDNKIQSNIALLGFKCAVNGSLAKYNLQDQIIDEYEDATGIDAGASTNESLTSGVYSGKIGGTPSGATSTDTSIAGHTTMVLSAASGNIVVGNGGNVDILVVGGGGSGGNDYGGGGGARGFIMFMENMGQLSPSQREMVIDQVMSLEDSKLSMDDLKWVVMMVIGNSTDTSVPTQWLESIVFYDDNPTLQ